jgi:prepilin-type N-terminal cleavage/methylation domain-containing protein
MIRLSRQSDAVRCPSPAGFTLVELMVVMVVLALLAALTLSGLAGVRDRAKADKTRTTIRKINDIILPQYESYLSRRVLQRNWSPASVWNPSTKRFITSGTITSSTSAATNRLWGLRLLMTLEMPDQWSDVAPAATLPNWAITAPVKRYAALKTSGTVAPSTAYEGAECLAMIVLRGGFDPDLVELFRGDELGDLDGDRHPEFLDGWGRPIGFIRWPVGFESPLQPQDASLNPDPFDPQQRSVAMTFPAGNQRDYGVTPLVYSGGADAALVPPVTDPAGTTPAYGGYYAASDVASLISPPPPASWVSNLAENTAASILTSGSAPSLRTITSATSGPGTAIDPASFPNRDNARDNITNFDLMKK